MCWLGALAQASSQVFGLTADLHSAIPFHVLDPLERLQPSLIQCPVMSWLLPTLPEPARAGFPIIPAPPAISLELVVSIKMLILAFGGLKRDIDSSCKTQIWHNLPTTGLGQEGVEWFLQPLWWLGGIPIAPSSQGAENTRFQSDLSSGLNEDNDLYFKKLELINIHSVLCFQTQLPLLHIVLLLDLTYKLLLSIPQWFAATNKPSFMKAWRVHAQRHHAHLWSHISHAITHLSSKHCSSHVAAEVCTA